MFSESLAQNQGHFAWCALLALHLAKQDGKIRSAAHENLFLIRWLTTALKQHRFPRELAPEMHWLINQGKIYGVRANLTGKLDYLWRSCTSELLKQDDLFRLTCSLERAKNASWQYYLLSDREWSGRHAVKNRAAAKAIYISRTSLDAAFDNSGHQIHPLMAQITGQPNSMCDLLYACGWQAVACTGDQPASAFLLIACQNGGGFGTRPVMSLSAPELYDGQR